MEKVHFSIHVFLWVLLYIGQNFHFFRWWENPYFSVPAALFPGNLQYLSICKFPERKSVLFDAKNVEFCVKLTSYIKKFPWREEMVYPLQGNSLYPAYWLFLLPDGAFITRLFPSEFTRIHWRQQNALSILLPAYSTVWQKRFSTLTTAPR